jgi:energy-converting hydrogenase Eha subunit E
LFSSAPQRRSTSRTTTGPFAYSFLGAIVAVVASWLAIAAYGVSPIFLYVGVVLALLSPIAVGYTFYRELRD